MIELDLPPAWLRLEVAPDGARAAQRALVDEWFHDQPVTVDLREAAVTRLAQESRRASRAGVGFAAVLFVDLDDPLTEVHCLVAGSVTVSFRTLPGARDPRVAAEGTLQSLRRQAPGATGYATRRLELVGLARDADRPAVLLREQRLDAEGTPMALTQVLWLVPGSSQLAQVGVATPNRELAASFTELALGVASGLRVC